MTPEVRQMGAGDELLLTARRLLAWRGGGRLPRLPEAAILTHQTTLFRRLAPRFGRRGGSGIAAETYAMRGTRGQVVVVGGLGVGAPATAIAVEELAVAGVRRLIGVDIAGSLDAGVGSGDAVLVEAALALDGTSPHYAADDLVRPRTALADALAGELRAASVPFAAGVVWSTDAPYRETPSLIEAQRGRGAVLVDMETAALFAVAAAVGIEAAAVLVAADELFDGWRPPADPARIQSRLRQAATAAVACLRA
jgi:uridine phosphorylase